MARILLKLSERSEVTYRPTTEAHAKFVRARMRESSERQCRMVLWFLDEVLWAKGGKHEEMRRYLRPSTVFNASKFAEYLPQAEAAWAKENEVAGGHHE